MVNVQEEIIYNRNQLKQSITDRIERTFPAYFFHWMGRFIQKIFGLQKPLPWAVNAFSLCILVFTPGLLVAIITGGIRDWDKASWTLLGIYIYAYIAPIVSHVNVTHNLLPRIRDEIVELIQTTDDINKLSNWFDQFFSLRDWFISMLFGGIVFFMLMFPYMKSNVGMMVISLSVSTFFSIPFWVIFKVLTLPNELSKYNFLLYELNPSKSEVVQRLIDILNDYFYIVALYVTGATVIASFHPSMKDLLWICLFFGWGPSITQFFINQRSIQKIIANGKWRTLNLLQEQVRQLKATSPSDTSGETILRINQLMDFHDRVSATPDTLLNISVWGSLLQQLFLPLLALILGNFDSIIKMLIR
ncbi:MAG: hypothetical protein U0X74_01810 [Anaerolineales bacterium]